MIRITFTLVTGLFLYSCSPKIKSNLSDNRFQAFDKDYDVLILEPGDIVPKQSLFVGDLKIGDTGFSTDCGYKTVISNAKTTARNSGANIVHLTEVRKPNFGSTCYRIKANMYRNMNTDILVQLKEEDNLKNRSALPDDADYAIVYFYRPKVFSGSMVGYKIRTEDDNIIGRVRNGEKFEYKTSEFGEQIFYGKTEVRDSVIINIQKGEEYFVRCGITLGVAVGKPELYIIDNHVGRKEYAKLE